MRIIGLTGSIACGKTTVSNHLRSLGYPVVDGDQLARDLTVPGSPVLAEIRQVFGDRYINASGNLNRRALGQLIFHDDGARKKLDQLMEPHLWRLTQDRIRFFASQGAVLCFLDMPLLFEKGYDQLCQSVWTVWLPLQQQLDRLISRDGFTREDAVMRIQAVMSSDEKASRATSVIDNSGSIEATLHVVDRLVCDELNLATAPVDSARDYHHTPSESSGASLLSAPPLSRKHNTDDAQLINRDVMDRPKASRQKMEKKKAAWQLPSWVLFTLASLTVLLLICSTLYFLKSARLKEARDQHDREQAAVHTYYHYPEEFYRDDLKTQKTSVFSLAEQYAEDYNLNPAFVLAVMRNESSFNPKAESRIGARGLMQLMEDTADWIAGKLNVKGYTFDMMWDPSFNIRFGCWYLNYLSNTFDGDPVCVISAYHAGQGSVRSWLGNVDCSNDGRTINIEKIPIKETRDYVKKVTKDYGIYQELLYSGIQPNGTSDDSAVTMQ